MPFNVRSKAGISLIYRTEPTRKSRGKTKKIISKTDKVRSIGKESWESGESVLKKKRKGTVGRICRKEGFKPGMKE